MIFFIIGVLAALVALAVLLLSEEGKAAAFIPGVVAVILIGVSCVSYVPTGYTGIVTTFGKVEDGTKDAGVVFKSPWQSIYYMGEILIPVTTEDKHMVGLICWSQLAPVEDEIKNNGFIRYYQRKRADGRTYYVVKNGMRVRAAVMSYSLNEYAEATLQELVAMLAETHTGEPEEHEQTFDNLTDEVENEANNEDV